MALGEQQKLQALQAYANANAAGLDAMNQAQGGIQTTGQNVTNTVTNSANRMGRGGTPAYDLAVQTATAPGANFSKALTGYQNVYQTTGNDLSSASNDYFQQVANAQAAHRAEADRAIDEARQKWEYQKQVDLGQAARRKGSGSGGSSLSEAEQKAMAEGVAAQKMQDANQQAGEQIQNTANVEREVAGKEDARLALAEEQQRLREQLAGNAAIDLSNLGDPNQRQANLANLLAARSAATDPTTVDQQGAALKRLYEIDDQLASGGHEAANSGYVKPTMVDADALVQADPQLAMAVEEMKKNDPWYQDELAKAQGLAGQGATAPKFMVPVNAEMTLPLVRDLSDPNTERRLQAQSFRDLFAQDYGSPAAAEAIGRGLFPDFTPDELLTMQNKREAAQRTAEQDAYAATNPYGARSPAEYLAQENAQRKMRGEAPIGQKSALADSQAFQNAVDATQADPEAFAASLKQPAAADVIQSTNMMVGITPWSEKVRQDTRKSLEERVVAGQLTNADVDAVMAFLEEKYRPISSPIGADGSFTPDYASNGPADTYNFTTLPTG